MSADESDKKALTVTQRSSVIARSTVPTGLKYGEYRKHLRYDFFHSCAYCTMTEAEAQAIRFCIDHYEPRKARPDLEHSYENLMYACDECNSRKGDRCPPPNARTAGIRFFKVDQDAREDHFRPNGIRVDGKTPAGEYSIAALDLNRAALRKLRELRRRVAECDRQVADGIVALRAFSLDRLPQHIKGRATTAIKNITSVAQDLSDRIDSVLREHARSPLLDEDEEAAASSKERAAKLRGYEGLHAGSWRAPRVSDKGKR